MNTNPEAVIGHSEAQDTIDSFYADADNSVMTVTTDSQSSVDIDVEATRFWTLSEAATNLGLSTRTILRRLKTGSLKGTKVQGANGPEWRIAPVTEVTGDKNDALPIVTAVTPDKPSTDDTTIATLVKVIAEQSEQLRVQSEHLQAATYLIQNQHQQIVQQAEQIKLLEDRSRHRAWWHRLNSWFVST